MHGGERRSSGTPTDGQSGERVNVTATKGAASNWTRVAARRANAVVQTVHGAAFFHVF